MSNKSNVVGLPPGSLVYKGPKRKHTTELSLIRYNKEIHEFSTFNIEDYKHTSNTVDWIDINGIHDEILVEKIGAIFNLHPLLLEDVMDTNQRPSIEEHGEYTFLKLKMLSYNKVKNHIEHEQVSLVLGHDFVISFQEKPGDIFEPLRKRIEGGRGKIRGKKSDYLFYAIIDIIVDNYFTIIEEIGIDIDRLENEVFEDPDQKILQKIQRNKKQLLILRKSIYPMREVIAKIQKQEYKLIQTDNLKYFNDLYDNVIHIIDALESYRDINSGLKDFQLPLNL